MWSTSLLLQNVFVNHSPMLGSQTLKETIFQVIDIHVFFSVFVLNENNPWRSWSILYYFYVNISPISTCAALGYPSLHAINDNVVRNTCHFSLNSNKLLCVTMIDTPSVLCWTFTTPNAILKCHKVSQIKVSLVSVMFWKMGRYPSQQYLATIFFYVPCSSVRERPYLSTISYPFQS